MRAVDGLSQWFFAPAPARRLALVRIAVATYGIAWLGFSFAELTALGRIDEARFRPVGIVAVLDIAPVGPGVIAVCWTLTLLSGCFVVAGRCHRLAGPAFAAGLLLLTTYQNSWGKLLHTENLLVLHALILAASPAGGALVLGARRHTADSPRYGWPLRAMAIGTVLAYLVAGMTKMRHGGLAWMTAENLQNWVAFDLVRKELFGDPYLPVAVRALDHAWVLGVAAVFTVAVELAAPLALVRRRWTQTWVAAAWTMHAGVLAVMAVGFPYQLVGVAFLPLLAAPGRAGPGPAPEEPTGTVTGGMTASWDLR